MRSFDAATARAAREGHAVTPAHTCLSCGAETPGPLAEAREIFAHFGAGPALAEAETVLERTGSR
jgi:hypothetical protein